MKFRHLLVASALVATATSVSAFKWTPAVTQPNPSLDVTQSYQLETLRFGTNDWGSGYQTTDVMPIWIDEDENEIVGRLSSETDASWDQFVYTFDFSSFKMNGEYILKFPEGLLVNAAGEKSDELEIYYTVAIPELASGMFSDFEVLSISPDFSEPQGLWSDQKITINTNHNEAIGFVTLQIYDPVAGEYLVNANNFSTGRNLGDASAIVFEVANTYKFYDDREYTAEFVFYNGPDDHTTDGIPTPIVAKKSYKFTGKIEGYKYSPEKLLSIDPEPGTLTISEPSQAVFTYTFSGPVNVYKVTTPRGNAGDPIAYPASCITSNEDKTVWTIDLSDNDYVNSVDAQLTLKVYARDMDGYQLRGNDGEEEGACYESNWQCDLGAKAIVVVSPEYGASIESLTEIVVKAENGEEMTWSWNGEAYVTAKEERAIIGYLNLQDGDDASATEFHFTTWSDGTPINLTAQGDYAIYFGPGCFNFGEQFEEAKSKSLYSMFSITDNGDTPDDPVVDPAEQEVFFYTSIDPEDGATVETLDVIKLWYPEMVNTMGKDAYVYNKADQSLVSDAQVLYDWDDVNLINIELLDPVTKAGEYEIVIPRGAICSDEFFNTDGKAGICNPEIRLNYTVNPNGSADPQEALEYVRVYPEMASAVESLDQIVLTFAEAVTCDDFTVEVYSVARNLIATGNGRTDWSEPNVIVVDFDQPIVEEGKYEVVIPQHVIINGEYYETDGKAGLCNPEYRLYYTVVPNGQVDPVDPALQEVFNYTSVDPASGSTVSSLDVIRLWFPDVPVCNGFDAYLYKADAVGMEDGIVATAFVLFDWDDDLMVNATFSQPVTEDGDYVFVIPARMIGDDAFLSSDGKQGICNPEIRLNYTVGNGSGVVSVADAVDCDVYDLNGRVVLRKASAAGLKTLSKGIYVVGGKKMVVK
ncbi:MAG: hypothetical protein K2N35_08745 [Muribaculaceae bacterium]|nr:hypothetical protein [Muribaculaceae bacterium]